MAGGKGTGKPRLADKLCENLNSEDALELIGKIIDYYKKNTFKWDRFSLIKTIEEYKELNR